ncbi:MAG: sigma 54-interacting transcriptional regulator, partial [Desulfobacteraceae bacterium]|nr:sigma 54-interacting transcriptional regulator [Desulfobacteraceae bacterium]
LIEALELSAERQGQIASDLMRDIRMRQGTEIIGGSPLMEHLRREIELVARSDFTVLVLGETGVGKELVVRAIHAASERRDDPMLYLNCAALPETLADSELFGHTKGAFTGAGRDRAGKFELADGGTLF